VYEVGKEMVDTYGEDQNSNIKDLSPCVEKKTGAQEQEKSNLFAAYPVSAKDQRQEEEKKDGCRKVHGCIRTILLG
jgi:hypothetical protein